MHGQMAPRHHHGARAGQLPLQWVTGSSSGTALLGLPRPSCLLSYKGEAQATSWQGGHAGGWNISCWLGSRFLSSSGHHATL